MTENKKPRHLLMQTAIFILFTSLLILVGIQVVKYRRAGSIAENPQPSVAAPVVIQKPTRETLRRELELTGWTDAGSRVAVQPKASGTLMTLEVDVGATVMEGQTIGTIDPTPYQLALDQATIARDGAQHEFERAKKLYETGSIAHQNFDQARLQAELTEAQYNVALLNRQNCLVKAPISGKISQTAVDRGATVSPSTPIATIDATDGMVVIARIPEQYARFFAEGALHEARVFSPDGGMEVLTASLKHSAPYVRSDSRTFEAIYRLEGDTGTLMPGMLVKIRFLLEEHPDVPTLPLQALAGGRTIWILDRDTMMVIPVDLANFFNDGTRFEVPAEYADSEIVVEGQQFLDKSTIIHITGEVGPNENH